MSDAEMWVAADRNGERYVFSADPGQIGGIFTPSDGNGCMSIPACVVSPALKPYQKVRGRWQSYGAVVDCSPPPVPEPADYWGLRLEDGSVLVDENDRVRKFATSEDAVRHAEECDELEGATAMHFVRMPR